MMNYKEIQSERNYKAGYKVITGIVDGSEFSGDDFKMSHAETPNGDFIGNSKDAYRLCKKRGIKPEKVKSEYAVCSIGFCEKEQKWYGWSHRAIYGFGIGSETKKGDCSYVPADMEDARLDAIRFEDEEHHLDTNATLETDEDGKPCFAVTWTYSDKIPNKSLRSKISGCRHYPPEIFGHGEWTAKTLDDARKMACDFAEGVS